MDVFLPVAGVSLNLFLLIGVGGAVGFLSGLLGVGGGFLLTPLLIMLGIPPTVAAASDANAIVGASTSGTIAHFRAKNVDVKMGVLMFAGGIVGGFAGTLLVRLLRGLGHLDVVIIFLYVVLLAILGVVMFVDALTSRVKGESYIQRKSLVYFWLQKLPLRTSFPVSQVETSALAPILLGMLVGILAALMGVGGGFFLIPAMTFFLGMPMRVVVGTSLFQMLFTTGSVTIMQAVLNHNVDVFLALGLLIGSTLGAQIGARAANHLRADQLKIVFALLVLAFSVKMFNDLLLTPAYFLASLGGH
jgi:uncharacterized membrane protein YfcA